VRKYRREVRRRNKTTAGEAEPALDAMIAATRSPREWWAVGSEQWVATGEDGEVGDKGGARSSAALNNKNEITPSTPRVLAFNV